MFKSERQNQIIEILQTNGFATVKEISKLLYTSESSIRRDLTALENKGLVMRSYGGAEIVNSNTNVLPFSTRSYDNIRAKQIIASKAANLIKTGDIIFLDQSSTSYFLAHEIMDMHSITVVTNNLEILSLLSGSKIVVHSSGGMISSSNGICLIGNNAQRTFREIYADIVFFSSKSLSDDGIISDCTQEETFIRNAMFENAAKKVFLCNSSKLDTHSAYKQCTLSDIDILVTENDAGKIFKEQYTKLEIL